MEYCSSAEFRADEVPNNSPDASSAPSTDEVIVAFQYTALILAVYTAQSSVWL
jgi:hypothetical protein